MIIGHTDRYRVCWLCNPFIVFLVTSLFYSATLKAVRYFLQSTFIIYTTLEWPILDGYPIARPYHGLWCYVWRLTFLYATHLTYVNLILSKSNEESSDFSPSQKPNNFLWRSKIWRDDRLAYLQTSPRGSHHWLVLWGKKHFSKKKHHLRLAPITKIFVKKKQFRLSTFLANANFLKVPILLCGFPSKDENSTNFQVSDKCKVPVPTAIIFQCLNSMLYYRYHFATL